MRQSGCLDHCYQLRGCEGIILKEVLITTSEAAKGILSGVLSVLATVLLSLDLVWSCPGGTDPRPLSSSEVVETRREAFSSAAVVVRNPPEVLDSGTPSRFLTGWAGRQEPADCSGDGLEVIELHYILPFMGSAGWMLQVSCPRSWL